MLLSLEIFGDSLTVFSELLARSVGKLLPRHEIVTIEYIIPDDSKREHEE
jgi:hypothetical protein